MKKLLFLLLLFIIKPVYAMNPSVEYIDGVYANRMSPYKLYSGQMGFIMDNERVIYCVEPFNWIGDNYNNINSYFDNYDDYTKDYIKLVANYADSFVQNKNKDYYYAAQELIWQKITNDGVFSYTTEKNMKGLFINIESIKNEIDDYVNKFLKKPSFTDNLYTGSLYETIELKDTFNVLDSFNIINESKNEVWVKDNTLYIKFLSSEVGTIRFEKKSGSGDIKYYHSDSKQDLADLTGEVVNSSYITVLSKESYYNDYRIEFIDKDTNELINSNIDFKINQNDYSVSNGIFQDRGYVGEYEVEVINVPNNYIIPDNSSFNLTDGNINNYTHKVYLKKINEDKELIKENVDTTKEENNYCVLTDFKELPNTINYIKIIKAILIIIIIIEILRHVKELLKK